MLNIEKLKAIATNWCVHDDGKKDTYCYAQYTQECPHRMAREIVNLLEDANSKGTWTRCRCGAAFRPPKQQGMSVPERTCPGCRRANAAEDLIDIVKAAIDREMETLPPQKREARRAIGRIRAALYGRKDNST